MATMKDTGRKLALLMWKHYYLRRNRWILSLMEIFLPILTVYALAKNADSIVNSQGIIQNNATIDPAVSTSDMYRTSALFAEIIYTPDTADLGKLMKTVVQIINKSASYSKILLRAVENETSLERLLSVNSTGKVGVVFQDASALNNESGHWNYKIRDDNYWFTDQLFDENKGPVKSDFYYHRGYAGLQLALNEAFLNKEMTNPYQKMWLQPFPYPEYTTENDLRKFVPNFVCYVVIWTLLILSIPLITAIIEEKESGVKELMKIVGLEEWLIWMGWFFHALAVSLFSFTVVTYMLQHDFGGPHSAAIRYVAPTVLWSSIILYCIANTAFCFTFASIFHQTTIASSIFGLTIVLISYGSSFIANLNSLYLVRLSCLFPMSAFTQGFLRIQYFELHDIPLTWSNLNSSERNTNSISVGFMFFMLMFDTLLYLFLAFYFSAINPGKFGAKKSPFFIFERLRSTFGDHSTQELVNLEDPQSDDRYMEKAPANLETTIKIKDLHKNFGSVFAVKGVNLNVYKGEITALLGHNGAGKTTTLAILTGIIEPTDGSITYKNKLDVLKKMNEFRKNLGMCPQEDRLFPYLSVKNHLIFFGMLKGASKQEASREAAEYLRIMEIDGKANSLVSDLSGGMKRKLCLSIALMGKAETLILDEPTSGLDVESRRRLWDLLLEMRGNRTIILTTHHMEEADALGDRIAIMNHGTIVCHGTSLFLKKSYGTGYQVTITKHQHTSVDPITNTLTIDANIPDVVLENSSETEVVYKLPLTETNKFPALFRNLESKTSELGVENIGVSCTTMEQVFLKVGGVSIYDSAGGLSRKNSTVTDGAVLAKYAEKKKVGLALILQQIQALMLKKWLYASRNWLTFIFRVIFPSLILIFFLRETKEANASRKPLTMSLATYPNANVMVQNNTSPVEFTKFLEYLNSYGDNEIKSQQNNIVLGLLQYGREQLASYQRELPFAIEFNDTSTVLLYNKHAIHSLPIIINSYANVLLLANNKMSDITMISHPVNPDQVDGDDSNYYVLIFTWFLALVFFTIDLNTYFVTGLNVERIDGFKHIQLMSNVSPLTYWLSNFFFDVLFYMGILLMRIIIFKIVDDEFGFLRIDSHFVVLTFILILFAASYVLFSFVVSHLSSSKEGSYVLLFIMNIVGASVVCIFYLIRPVMEKLSGTTFWEMIFWLVKYVIMLMPSLNYSLIFIKFFNIWYKNTACVRSSQSAKCESDPYLVFASEDNKDGMLEEVIFLFVDIIIYSALLCVIQMGYLEKMVNNLVTRLCKYPVNEDDSSPVGDEDVQLEKTKVQRLASERAGHTSQFVLIAQGLRKNFFKLFRPFTAVADIHFTIKHGECFGLLGVNGAGKSTTFRMLTADLLPTEGDSSLLGYKLSTNKNEYLSKAGYCAQSNCFLEELSGREMLTLIASLRGIHSDEIKNMVDKWLSILGLEEYQNQYCGKYSGGNKRKLCTAMSLIGEPSAVFLDEPTSGVDPVARRKLYAVMDQSKASGQAVILTSHSMEECENLCDRMTILVKGRMRCIGTAQHLKKTYAQGFSVLIKISDTVDEDSLLHLKRAVVTEFQGQCVLKDEHKTQLYYQITNVSLLWSTLFEKMEKLKNENREIIDDYSLSDTSLEEVFISFAKQQVDY